MANYMTQTMRSGIHPSILYYRKQSSDHPSHAESGAFTQAAIADYSATYAVPLTAVEEGTYRSNQGKPKSPNAEKI